jgi:hypothetical protein
MTLYERFDKLIAGLACGFILPFLVASGVYIFTARGISITDYMGIMAKSDILVKVVSFYVFPNLLIFLLFNRFDMLRASKGVLYITIFWALVVFAIRFLG